MTDRKKPMLPRDSVARLVAVGEALYGKERWQARMAAALDTSKTTITRWRKHGEIPADLDGRLALLAEQEATRLIRVLDIMRELRARARGEIK